MLGLCCEPERRCLWRANLEKSSRETIADDSSESISGRDHESKKRNYYSRTIHGSMKENQTLLTTKLRSVNLGRDLEAAKITLNEYRDRWRETAV